jgi:hypothetical protein
MAVAKEKPEVPMRAAVAYLKVAGQLGGLARRAENHEYISGIQGQGHGKE